MSGIGHLGRDRSQIKRLQAENARLQEQVRLGQLDRARLAELQSLYRLTQKGRMKTAAARVVAVGGSFGFESTAAIDIGSRDGIRKNMTVINGDGLVGRVERVGPTTSTVLLAVDRDFTVFARLAPGLETGYVSGVGPQAMSLSLLSQTASVHSGQTLVTVGPAGASLYAPEIPVGVVTRVRQTPGALTRTAVVRPFVDFTGLDIVGVVIQAPSHLPRGALLPPSPTPSPTPRPAPTPSGSGSPRPGASSSPTPSPSRSR